MLNDEHFTKEDDFENAMADYVAMTKASLVSSIASMLSVAESEEIAQEAYLKVFTMAKANPLPETPLQKLLSLKPMLYVMAKNLAISSLRHAQVVSQHAAMSLNKESEDRSSNIETNLHQAHQHKALMQAINQLPPICRQVFIQRKLHDKSHAQIAAMLEISHKTVEAHLARGLVLCRQYLQDQNSTVEVKKALGA